MVTLPEKVHELDVLNIPFTKVPDQTDNISTVFRTGALFGSDVRLSIHITSNSERVLLVIVNKGSEVFLTGTIHKE